LRHNQRPERLVKKSRQSEGYSGFVAQYYQCEYCGSAHEATRRTRGCEPCSDADIVITATGDGFVVLILARGLDGPYCIVQHVSCRTIVSLTCDRLCADKLTGGIAGNAGDFRITAFRAVLEMN
jgi:hypothetical protein